MPEVVYPTNDAQGNARTWDEVFPIWKIENNDTDWQFINNILYQIALNNRFGGKSPKAFKNVLIKDAKEYCDERLNATPLEDELTRKAIFAQLGMTLYYIDKVFENLGGAYREYKK